MDKEKIIFLEHEPVKLSEFEERTKSTEYILERQENHNRILEQSNRKLQIAAMEYPFEYAITTPSTYFSLAEAGYKYVLQSNVYKYNHLMTQPPEGELLVFEYFIFDMQNNIAYEVFRLDEMKVYDLKLVIKKLNKAIKEAK
ncbi:hypothetical protein N9515_03210 [Vicingaceae bacterium]|nr:hypothetical protein [Vicingaceae bacterium]MDB4060950.1 hypothetical protein [Vicingaceae bacterium]